MTLTPFFFDMFFARVKTQEPSTHSDDLYRGFIFTIYKVLLRWCLRHWATTVVLALLSLVGGLIVFANVNKTFSRR